MLSPEIEEFLKLSGLLSVKELSDGRIACILPLIYTGAIVITTRENYQTSIEERYCYHSVKEVTQALAAWNGTGEPEGWHRHIPSGRRRNGADPMQEYILA